MRSLKFAAVVFMFGLVACGGPQPRLYDVAVDTSSLLSLPATCYRATNQPGPDTVTLANGFTQRQWNLWDGTESKLFLDVGQNTWNLGDANAVQTGTGSSSSLPSLIQGGPLSFTESRTFTRNSVSPAEVDTRTVTVSFDATPAETATGTIDVKSNYQCASCGQPSCEVTFKFTARKIDSQSTSTIYSGR